MTQDDLPKSEPRAPETPDASAPTAHHGLIVALGIKQVLTPTSASNTLLIPQDVNISEIEGCAIRLRRNTILLEHDYCVWLTFQGVCAIFYATGKKSCMLNIGGENSRKCYLTYLDVFISYYKTTRAPIPTNMEEDKESLESYTWTCATDAEKKGKETLEHFGIKLEEENEVCKNQQEAHYEKDRTHITCYKCKDLGHYAYECPRKIKNKEHARITSNKASTSKHLENEDTYSMTSDDFTIIT